MSATLSDLVFMVDAILTSKIPNLKDTMQKAREKFADRMDASASAIRLEEKILSLMKQVEDVCRIMVSEKTYDEEEEVFDALWWELCACFDKFTYRCKLIGVDIYDYECLSFLEDEEGSE